MKGTLALAAGLGVAALLVGVAAAPAEARKKSRTAQPVEAALPDPNTGEPMTLVVSLARQTVDVYRGTTHITSSRVSTGMRGFATKAGVFSILEKRRHHHSNLYSGAPMPWMQRLTWSGTALHGGVVPGYPASHGCVRLPFSFAPKLFSITTVGEHVVVARDPVTPRPIEHANLFNPLTPVAPSVVKQEVRPERESSNTVAPPPRSAISLPVVLARADVRGVASDVTPSIGGPAPDEDATDHAAVEPEKQPATGDAAPVEDTRSHAIDPFTPSSKPSTDHAIMTPEDGVATDHADADREDPPAAEQQAENKPEAEPASLISAPIAASPETTQSIVTAPSAPAAAPAAPAETAAAEPAPAKVEAPAAPAADTTGAEAKPDEVKPEEAKAAEATPPEVAPAATAPAEAKPAEPKAAEASPEVAPAPAPAATASSATAASETAPADPVPANAPETAAAPAAPVVPEAAPVAVEAAKVIPASVSAPAQQPAPPALPEAAPTLASLSLEAGTKAAALEAAEPRSTAPLRILVTRRTKTDRIIGVQNILAELGHLERQNFDGTLGRPTIVAIKAFQKANGLPETGAFNEELVKKVYEVAGKGEPPEGHLFVRQEFGRVFDAPVSFKDPEKPLGTHLFTTLKFAPGDTKARWMAISVQGDDSTEALDRLQIPDNVRRNISERLTPGSSLIIGDVAINSATLPKGADFLVWAKDMPAKVTAASYEPEAGPRPRKKKKVARAPRRQQDFTFRYAPPARAYPPRTFNSGYPRWPF